MQVFSVADSFVAENTMTKPFAENTGPKLNGAENSQRITFGEDTPQRLPFGENSMPRFAFGENTLIRFGHAETTQPKPLIIELDHEQESRLPSLRKELISPRKNNFVSPKERPPIGGPEWP